MAMEYQMQRCAMCGLFYIHEHSCVMRPTTQKVPWIPGTVPAKNLTEEDVRRIVREEVVRLGLLVERDTD